MKKVDYQELCDEVGIEYNDKTTSKELQQLLADFKNPEGSEQAPVKTKHNGDITFDIILTTADGEPHETQISIHNPCGCMLASKVNDADYIMRSIKEGLVDRFGRQHVK